jgi:hypothetical protein
VISPAYSATVTAPAAAPPAQITIKSFHLVSGLGSRCLAVQGAQPVQGAKLIIWACANSAEQEWAFPSDGTIRPFGNAYGNLCLDIQDPKGDGKTMVAGDHPQVWACNSQPNQKLNFSGGVIQTSNGWLFDLPGGDIGSWFSGAINVDLHVRNNGDNQRFVAGLLLPVGSSVSMMPSGIAGQIVARGPASVLSSNGSALIVIPSGIVASGAGNIVASGAGNIVASGAGNIVASGAGNMVVVPYANGIVASGAGN